MSPQRYLAALVAGTLAVLTFVAAFNIAVDPYAVFGRPRIEFFNARKATAINYTAMSKSYQIEQVAPRTVLLGTSRVDIGFDPDYPAWPASDRPVYNFGVPEGSILALESQLRHAERAGPVRRAVVGLEFHDFLRPRVDLETPPSEIEQRFVALGSGGSERTLQQLMDRANSAVTLKALIDSGFTIASQFSRASGDIGANGLTSETPYAVSAANDGLHLLFQQKDQQLLQARRNAMKLLENRPVGEFAEMPQLQSLIQFAQSRHIELDLVIPPYHAHYYEIVDAAGLWPRFEAWKTALTQVVEENRRREGAVRVSLWDFASYDAYTTEPVPPKGDRRALMKWFWEPVHFRKALGDRLLARLLGESDADFGVQLTPQTLDSRLNEGRVNRDAYRARKSPDLDFDLMNLVKKNSVSSDTAKQN